MKKSPDHPEKPKKHTPPPKPQSIPLPIVHDEEEDTNKEMQELFDEDKVTHEHGGSEPERD
jgi:hypothetical protein